MPEPKLFVESICEDNRKFYDDKRGLGALKDLQQTFPHPWLYVAELLQNAVDAGSTRIALTLRDDQSVIFEHNGDKFSPEDVDALCSRGVSTKEETPLGSWVWASSRCFAVSRKRRFRLGHGVLL